MNISNINNNLNNNTGLEVNNKINETKSLSQINDINNEDKNLFVKDYNKSRDELSLNLQSLNDGIAISKFTQKALDINIQNLTQVEQKFTELKNDNQFETNDTIIKNELFQIKEQNHQIKYKNENIFVENNIEENLISIVTQDTYHAINKPDMTKMINDLIIGTSTNDLNSSLGLENAIGQIHNTIDEVKSVKEQFAKIDDELISSAKSSINNQMDLSKKMNLQINFGKEVMDFSKTNILANIGYLVASQANIVQEQSTRLLS